MAKESGGGGGVGWALLGFVAGVAATLGLQVLIGGREPTPAPPLAQAPAVAPVMVANTAPVVKAAKKPVVVADPPEKKPDVQPDGQVADDAAAAGMTSRMAPTDDVNPGPAPTVNN
jgi:hypothetical protein